jgi:hypothetical protein
MCQLSHNSMHGNNVPLQVHRNDPYRQMELLMYNYKYTVMSSEMTKGDQNSHSQSPNEKKTDNIICRRIKHQLQALRVFQVFLFSRVLRVFQVSIMSKRGPSVRELHIDYSIDCPVYLGRWALPQGLEMCIQVNKVRSQASDISRAPLGGGDSTDRTSQANLRKLSFTNTLYQLAYSQVLLLLKSGF